MNAIVPVASARRPLGPVPQIATERGPQAGLANQSGGFEKLASLGLGLPAGRVDDRTGLDSVARARMFAAAMSTAVDDDPASYREAYKNGDVVFLIGNLEDSWTEKEWNRFYGIAKWCVNNSFRIVINPVAEVRDVRAAVQDDRTKVIIWSSHASSAGVIRDANKEALPDDIFSTDAGRNFRQVIFSACSGDAIAQRYTTSDRVTEIYWNGTTNSDDLFGYLYGERWNPKKFGPNEYDD